MNQTAKRILSLVLCLAMLVGVFPAFALTTKAAETPLAAAIFGSDIHEESTSLTDSGTSAMKSIMSQIGTNGVTYNTIGFVGDTYTDIAGTMAAMTSAAQTALGQSAEVYYAYGDHDEESDISPDSGLLYTGDYYYIYHISDANMRSKVESQSEIDYKTAISSFETAAASMDKSKVLFIMSHVPLHDRRDDNTYANDWYTAIKAVADTMEVVFFWAHNHTEENEVDEAAYYVARDGSEQITIYGGDTVTPNFTYMNAGYIYAAGQNPSRKGVVTTVKIYEDQLVFQDYNSSGEYTDSTYSHNVTVTREFTDSADSGSTDTTDPTEDTTDPSEETTTPTEETTAPSEGETSGNETDYGTYNEVTLGGSVTTTEEKTIYVLVDEPEDGEEYLIVSNDYALVNSSGSATGVSVTDNGSITINGTTYDGYIELSNSNAVWTAGTGWTFKNGSYYLYHSSNSRSYSLDTSSANWSYNDSNRLYYSYTSGRKTESGYFYYSTSDNEWTLGQSSSGSSSSSSSRAVYFYKELTYTETTTTDTTVKYTMRAADLEKVVTAANETAALDYCLQGNGTDLTTLPSGGSYSYEILSDGSGIISSTTDGTVTFTGATGSATVKVAYTWTVDGETYTVYKNVTVTAVAPVYSMAISEPESNQLKIGATTTLTAVADMNGTAIEDAVITWSTSDETIATVDANGVVTGVAEGTATITATWTDPKGETHTDSVNISVVEAVYTLDLCEKTENEDGTYTTTSITKPIVIKEVDTLVTNGTNTYSVWAVITKDGEDIGTLSETDLEKLTFVSSNEAIATVDKTTGTVTFTGEEGTVQITAYYEYADGKYVTDLVTFSISKSSNFIPTDGTDDFPTYPEEGAIRYDKNATAVGNFSETGVAKVELSMTGVPYSTGKEIDVVVMLDMTGSMSDNGMEAAELATIAFVEKIVKNEDESYNDNRVAVYAFNSGDSSPYELVSLGTITSDDDLATASTAIKTASDKQASGGTPFDEATKQCYDVLQAAKSDGTGDDRQQFCVFMSDGGPTSYYGSDEKTYYNSDGQNSSGDVAIETCMTGYSSSTSSDWSFTLPTEYYTDAMKADGVTVYTVGLLLQTAPSNPAPYSSMTDSTYDSTTDSLTSIGSHYYFTSSILKQMATDESKYIDIFNVDNASKATAAFEAIAKSIREAATDVIVEDQITDKYTMIFEAPNAEVDGYDDSQEYYIEVLDYALTPVYKKDANGNDTTVVADYVRGTSTTLVRVYLAQDSSGNYYAASDNAGTAFAAPTFTTDAVGTMHYWTTTAPTGDADTGIQVTVSDTIYYFVPAGNGTHNITDGAYASGTLTEETVTKSDGTTATSSTSQDLLIITEYFVYNAETRMLYWTAEKLNNSELALSYFLYLNESGGWVADEREQDPGTYDTNVEATITYTNFQDHRCQQEFPVPQMTWKGAQVSYVFYLVNEDGDPVNRAGRVIPFSEAVYVTDVHTKRVVWNSELDVTSLNAAQLAEDLVPEVYELYDEQAYYEINVYESTDKGQDYFIIEGSSSVANTDTTKVFNTKAGTRYTEYGAYSNISGTYKSAHTGTEYTATVTTGFDYCNTTVAFAVVWQPGLVKDTVVVDYGLDVVINVSENDNMASGVVGVRASAPAGILIGQGNYEAAEASYTDVVIGTGDSAVTIGTAAVDSQTSVRFSMNKDNGMQFWKEAVFYYEADVSYYDENETVVTTSMYTSVTVIPATTIYYEDEYVDLKTYEAKKNDDGSYVTDDYGNPVFDTVGTDGWDTNSVTASADQQQDRPGASQISAQLDADNVYGYDSAYASMSSHSMNNAAKINVNAYKKGEATFTFYGTGFDVISVTSNMSGTLMVQVSQNGTSVENLVVDTYYGYTRDENGEWVTSVNDPNALYQVPVIKVSGLTYGQYTVKIVAAYNDFFNHTATAGSYDLYLDAIRIYDPTGNRSDVANAAYVKDGEGWPIYKELRNLVITADSFGSYLTVDSTDYSDVTVSGAVFIDSNDSGASISDYTSYGPNNELYLDAGQAVAFRISDVFINSSNAEIDPVGVQLAIKTVGTSDAQVEIFNPSISTSSTTTDSSTTTTKTFVKGNLISETIQTATDMYYDITALAGDTIVISNPGEEGIISITNLKFTFAEAATIKTVTTTNDDGTEETSEASVASISEEGAVYSLRSLRAYSVSETVETETETTEPETEATEPETTEPETEATEPETEATEPETEATEPETEATEPETEATEPEDDESDDSSLVGLIKKLLGWLFG